MAAASLRERFWAKVDIRGPDECWPWAGAVDRCGYGRFCAGDGRYLVASRVALEWLLGCPLGGLLALHSCDNPPCCNLAHLFPGTRRDNMVDMAEKGRQARQTPPEVAAIIRARLPQDSAWKDARDLSEELGMNQYTVHSIATRRRFAWL